MFFKGLRTKASTVVILKNIHPVSNAMDKELMGIESAFYKEADKLFRSHGCNDAETPLAINFCVLTMVRDLYERHGRDSDEYTIALFAVANTMVTTATTTTHVSLERLLILIERYLLDKASTGKVRPHGVDSALNILASSLPEA